MTTITEITHGIYLIETEKARVLGGSGLPISSLVYYLPGPTPAIIETGPSSAVPELLDAFRHLDGYVDLRHIIVTHVHLDHAGGAGGLARQFPGAKVIVHERGAKHLIDPSRLLEASREAFGPDFEEQYGSTLPVPEDQVCRVTDGDVLELGSRKLRFVYAPGHAIHHMCIYDESSRGLFSGEALGRPHIPVVPMVAGFDPDAAIDTIERLGALGAEVILSSHSGLTPDAGRLIEAVRINMTAYREIILQAARAGESRQIIEQRVQDYQQGQFGKAGTRANQVKDIVTWHLAYFKRKGLI